MSSSHFYKGLFGAENFSGFSTKRATDPNLHTTETDGFLANAPVFETRHFCWKMVMSRNC